MKTLLIWLATCVSLIGAQSITNVTVGTPGAGAGDTLPVAFNKLNTNDTFLYDLYLAGFGTNGLTFSPTNSPTNTFVLVGDGTDYYWRAYAPNADWAAGASYLSAAAINIYGPLSGRAYAIPNVETWAISEGGIFYGDGSGLTNITGIGDVVTSFNTRTGDVTLTRSDVTNVLTGTITNDTSGYAYTAGTADSALTATSANTAALADRVSGVLTNNLTGTVWQGTSLTNLNASELKSGTVGTARLGTGTADGTTYLRGDGTWATPTTAGVTLAELQDATNNLSANRLVDGTVPLARLASGADSQFLRGDGTWTNRINGDINLGGDIVGWDNTVKVLDVWVSGRIRPHSTDGITNTIILYTHTQSGSGNVTNTIQITCGVITGWTQTQ